MYARAYYRVFPLYYKSLKKIKIQFLSLFARFAYIFGIAYDLKCLLWRTKIV